MTDRGPNRPPDGDISQADYDEAYDAGALKDPVPEGSVSVRSIATGAGVDVTRLLEGELVDYQPPVARKLGVRFYYGPDWESYVSAAQAPQLREYARALSG